MSKPSPAWLDLSLGILTAPVLVGLVVADRAGRWLRELSFEDQLLWVEERLPVLDPQQLTERERRGNLEEPHDQA